MNKTDNIEIAAARLIQNDIDLIPHPFKKMAQLLGTEESQFIQIIKIMKSEGLIHKFAAILRHQKAGYKKNALIIWSVPATEIEKAGKICSSFSFVSHCYERRPPFKNKYNLFTMVHSKTDDILSLTRQLSYSSGISDFLILESMQEYKKTSPEYF